MVEDADENSSLAQIEIIILMRKTKIWFMCLVIQTLLHVNTNKYLNNWLKIKY